MSRNIPRLLSPIQNYICPRAWTPSPVVLAFSPDFCPSPSTYISRMWFVVPRVCMPRVQSVGIVGIPGYDMRLVRVAAVQMCGQ